MIYRGNGTAVYYLIEALQVAQLQIGGTVWNWPLANTSDCYFWNVPYNLNTEWFDNTTLAYTQKLDDGATVESTWAGALVTPDSPLGVPYVSFIATTRNDDPIPTRYVVVGILRPSPMFPHHRGTEVLIRKNITYTPQSPHYFELPADCPMPPVEKRNLS